MFRVPDGQRVYAVGDIHGRLGLFEGLIAQIEEDDARRGRETVLSYPIEPDQYAELTFEDLRERLCALVPREYLEFLKGLEGWIVIGDYLFVHADIRPGVAIDEQSVQELRWIREPFLSADAPSPYCVVHGHTIYDQPLEQSGRVGIDAGAYQSGVLTALGLEGERRWFVATPKANS